MKKLTAKQWAFVAAYAQCGNKCAAYRAAYGCSRMSARTARRKAMELAALPHVRRELANVVAEVREQAWLGLHTLLSRAGSDIAAYDVRSVERKLKVIDALGKRLTRFAPSAEPSVTFNIGLGYTPTHGPAR